MSSKPLQEQERDVRDLLKRAERTPVKTATIRRDTLRRLIDLAHSEHPSLKTIAATHIKFFIKDFPDLEDDALNAVYDLCEDTVASVRIKGYAAIVDVSREQNKWIKRNADVLIQLLQSDEPEEVTFVKRALTQHLDMDPAVTLGVICDQIVPPDEPLDEEELAIRERLGSLVLAFLAGEAKRPLVERHANVVGSPGERVLVPGLFKAIAKISSSEVNIVVKDIIASLPSFKPPSPRGKALLERILARLETTLKSDLDSDTETASLHNSRVFMELAMFVAVEKQFAPPSQLLRFYFTHLTSKPVLTRFTEDDQSYVISNVARILTACEEPTVRAPPTAPAAERGKAPSVPSDPAEDAYLRRQILDVCGTILHIVASMSRGEHRPWSACHSIVQIIARRHKDARGQLPSSLIGALRRVDTLPIVPEESDQVKAAHEQVLSVIRSFLEPVKVAPVKVDPTPVPQQTGEEGQKGNVKAAAGDEPPEKFNANASVGSTPGPKKSESRGQNKRKADTPNGPPVTSVSTGSDQPAIASEAGHSGPLPPRRSPAPASSGPGSVPSAPRAERQRAMPPHLQERMFRSSPPKLESRRSPAGMSVAGPSAPERDPLRVAKRPRTDERARSLEPRPVGAEAGPATGNGAPGAVQAAAAEVTGKGKPVEVPASVAQVPSLLSRLAGRTSNGKPGSTPDRMREQERDMDSNTRRKTRGGGSGGGGGRRGETEMNREAGEPIVPRSVPAKRRAEAASPTSSAPPPALTRPAQPPLISSSSGRPRQSRSLTDPDMDPVGGYSIRGAAKAKSSPESGEGMGLGSLLQRMQPQREGSGHISDGGRKRKKSKYS